MLFNSFYIFIPTARERSSWSLRSVLPALADGYEIFGINFCGSKAAGYRQITANT